MRLTVDLHAHSPYAGASGKSNFERLSFVMKHKGIDVYGSGDILHEGWEKELDAAFPYNNANQMWQLPDGRQLMPQTEIIITMPYEADTSKRKLFHLVLLFESREAFRAVRRILASHGSALHIGRPFATFDSAHAFQDFIKRIATLKEGRIMPVPAHVMTPEGILGGKNPVDSIESVFGPAIKHVKVLESGLSADPQMLAAIASQSSVSIVSFSDSHSAQFNKLGREFTEIEAADTSTSAVLDALEQGKIAMTAEFPPFEGRYYLTGHRDDRPGHNGKGMFFEEERPLLCPLCGKLFIPGVKERLAHLAKDIPQSVQKFVYQIPLIEIIAMKYNIGESSKKAERLYMEIVEKAGRETNIWTSMNEKELRTIAPEPVAQAVIDIKANRFQRICGYDGQYGKIIC